MADASTHGARKPPGPIIYITFVMGENIWKLDNGYVPTGEGCVVLGQPYHTRCVSRPEEPKYNKNLTK